MHPTARSGRLLGRPAPGGHRRSSPLFLLSRARSPGLPGRPRIRLDCVAFSSTYCSLQTCFSPFCKFRYERLISTCSHEKYTTAGSLAQAERNRCASNGGQKHSACTHAYGLSKHLNTASKLGCRGERLRICDSRNTD